ncbi:Retrovirus-related Pol polyprotein from transposon 17.6, partial [Mucuna pruriens]
MFFGLCNSPITFQRCMIAIFINLIESIMEVYINNFSIYNTNFENYLLNLSKVLQRCEKVNLVLNWEKCHFMVKEGIVLGHLVDLANIEVIEKLTLLVNVKGVRSSLEHSDFYQCFIKDFFKISKPLSNLLMKDITFNIDFACLDVFCKLKEALITTLILYTYD